MSTTAAPLDYDTMMPRRSPVFRLSVMMFLQYAIWGIWLPILADYLGTPIAGGGLGFGAGQISWILGLAVSIGAVSAPFIAGQLADRVMNAERALAMLLAVGGVVQIVLAYQTSFAAWLLLSILYSVLYMPTLALTNSVAFANLTDRERQFPQVRTFGTIGWIVGSVGFSLAFQQVGVGLVADWPGLRGASRPDATAQIKYAMLVAGVISLGYAAFSLLALPPTPPRRDGVRELAFAAALRLITQRNVIALLVAALLVSMIHQVYFMRMGPYITQAIGRPSSEIGPIMAIGQVSEIGFLAVLGFFLKRLGYKWIIALGALSYAARYGIFATIPSVGGLKWVMLLHGMNYGFFFAGAFLFIEKIAPSDIRHSAQTAFGIVILGLGPVLAGVYSNSVLSKYAVAANGATDFGKVWGIQAGIALAAAVILIAAFPNRRASAEVDRSREREVDEVAP